MELNYLLVFKKIAYGIRLDDLSICGGRSVDRIPYERLW